MKVDAVQMNELDLSVPSTPEIEDNRLKPGKLKHIGTKVVRFIEESDWDGDILIIERVLNLIFWICILGAACFFAPICIRIMIR